MISSSRGHVPQVSGGSFSDIGRETEIRGAAYKLERSVKQLDVVVELSRLSTLAATRLWC